MPTATKSPDSKAETTDVLGYKNNNDFPINISSDQLGINTQVGPKKYVEDRQGRKINDPRLDYYAKVNGLLSKEYASKPVPVILLGGTPPAKASGNASVRAIAPSVPVRGVLNPDVLPASPAAAMLLRSKLPDNPATVVASPAASSASIGAMSVADAARAGLIPKPDRRDRFETMAPKENDVGGDRDWKKVPFVDQTAPGNRPVVPKGLVLKSADTSGVSALGADDSIASTTEVVAQDAGVTLPAVKVKAVAAPKSPKTRPKPRTPAAAAPAVAAATPELRVEPQKGVEFEGKVYLYPGNLKNALIAKFKGDKGMADEAYQPFKAQFAAIRAAQPKV